jgi:hypothetical protein
LIDLPDHSVECLLKLNDTFVQVEADTVAS